jgi:hypothetical protein
MLKAISKPPPQSTRNVVELFSKYIVAQYEDSSSGNLQFEASVKTFKHVYIYLNSISNNPLEEFDQIYAILDPILPEKTLLLLKCVQFTAHVRLNNLSYARTVLLDILQHHYSRISIEREKKKSDGGKSGGRKGRFPLDLATVSNFMGMLLSYTVGSDGHAGSGIISIGTSSTSDGLLSFGSRGPKGGSGHTLLFPLTPETATVDARRIQQRQSNIVFDIYRQILRNSDLLRQSKPAVADTIHEYGARAAFSLNKDEGALTALRKISKAYMANTGMQRLSLHILEQFIDKGNDKLACDLCLLLPLTLINHQSKLMQMVVESLGTSETHYRTLLNVCKRDLLSSSSSNPKFRLRQSTGLSVLRFVSRREFVPLDMMVLVDLTWRRALEDGGPSSPNNKLREAVWTIIKASCDLRMAREMHNLPLTESNDATHSAARAKASAEFAQTLVTIPEKIDRALSSLDPHSSSGKDSIFIINRVLEILLLAYKDTGLEDESWTTLQNIYDHFDFTVEDEEEDAEDGNYRTRGSNAWSPDSDILAIALGGNVQHVINSMLIQLKDDIIPSEFLTVSVFEACSNDDSCSSDGNCPINSELLLALWESLASSGASFVRSGRVLTSALNFAFSRDVKVGLAFAEVSIREAMIEIKTTNAVGPSLRSVLKSVFETVSTLQRRGCGADRGYALVPLATISILYHQYSFLSSSHMTTKLELDEEIVGLGAKVILRDYIVASSSQASSRTPNKFKLSFKFARSPEPTRVVAYLESCRALDESILVKLGSMSNSWLSCILTSYSSNLIPQPRHREVALRNFDAAVSNVLTKRMVALGNEISFKNSDNGYVEISEASKDNSLLLLREHLSPDSFVSAINLAAAPLREEDTLSTRLAEDGIDMAMERCMMYYNTTRGLFGQSKADQTTLALLNAASTHGKYLKTTCFDVLNDKIKARRKINGREIMILSEAAVRFGGQQDLEAFWSTAHESRELFSQSTAVKALLEAHMLTNNATGLLHWANKIISAPDGTTAYLPPAALKSLLLTYSQPECTLSCLDSLLPMLSRLSARLTDTYVTAAAEGARSLSENRMRYLPLSMKLLCHASRLLLQEQRAYDALALLQYVHPEIWPYDELLQSVLSLKGSIGVSDVAVLALSVLRRRDEIVRNGQEWYAFISEETRQSLCKLSTSRGGKDIKALLDKDQAGSGDSSSRLPLHTFTDPLSAWPLGTSSSSQFSQSEIAPIALESVPRDQITPSAKMEEHDTWTTILSVEEECGRSNVAAAQNVGVEKEEVQSGLLALLKLHRLADRQHETDLDEAVSSHSESSSSESEIGGGGQQQQQRWLDPESKDSLQAFELELESLGKPDHENIEADMRFEASKYVNGLLRGNVPQDYQVRDASRRLRASGSKASWKSGLQKTTNLIKCKREDESGLSLDVDSIVVSSLMQKASELLAVHGQQHRLKRDQDDKESAVAEDEDRHSSSASASEYWEVYNIARSLFNRKKDDTFRLLPSDLVKSVIADLLLWCKDVGELEVAVQIIESVGEYMPEYTLQLLPKLDDLLQNTKYLPEHRECVNRAFQVMEPLIHAYGSATVDMVPFLELSVYGALPVPRRSKRDDDEHYSEGGGLQDTAAVNDCAAAPFNSSQVLHRLDLLISIPEAFTTECMSSILRIVLHKPSHGSEIKRQNIDLALAILQAALVVNVYPNDKTCELLARLLMANGYGGISAQLFDYLRHQQYLCSLSSYKALVSHLALQASQAELIFFGPVVDVIDNVVSLTKSKTDSRPRLLADFLLLQVASHGCELDEHTRHRIRKYTPSE